MKWNLRIKNITLQQYIINSAYESYNLQHMQHKDSPLFMIYIQWVFKKY